MARAILTVPDVLVSNEGTLFLFTPVSDLARLWLVSNVQHDAQWFGQALVVEHRYARDLALGLMEAGFNLQ
jgi:hypothetical protein